MSQSGFHQGVLFLFACERRLGMLSSVIWMIVSVIVVLSSSTFSFLIKLFCKSLNFVQPARSMLNLEMEFFGWRVDAFPNEMLIIIGKWSLPHELLFRTFQEHLPPKDGSTMERSIAEVVPRLLILVPCPVLSKTRSELSMHVSRIRPFLLVELLPNTMLWLLKSPQTTAFDESRLNRLNSRLERRFRDIDTRLRSDPFRFYFEFNSTAFYSRVDFDFMITVRRMDVNHCSATGFAETIASYRIVTRDVIRFRWF